MQKLHSNKMSPNNNNNTATATFPSLKGETTPDVNASVTTKTTTTTRLTTMSMLPNRMTTTRCKNNRSKSNKNQFSRTTATPSTATTPATIATTTKTTARTTTKDTNRCNSFHTAFNDTFRQRLLLVVATVFLLLANDGHFGSSTKLVVHAEEFELANTTTLNVAAATATTTEEAFWQNGTESQTRLTEIGQQEINNSSTSWSSLTSSTSATTTTTTTPTLSTTKATATPSPATPTSEPSASWRQLNFSQPSFFSQYAKRSSSGNELWDGIIRDCYQRPSFSCFQKNVYAYLSDALEANDVNVTQRLKFFRNDVDYEEATVRRPPVTEAAVSQDDDDNKRRSSEDADVTGDGVGHAGEEQMEDEHLLKNEIPQESRGAPSSTPIEEVTNALYGKSVKFAMTHDIELRLPEVLFDGATFRISPRHFEGDGVIAKLELIPKQALEARLAGKILMKKIHKFLKSKLLLSFLALVLIVKIIKIKLFWLLPVVIGVGAAKKLLLKFLLFLFPALSHLFKLCSYYQQTYHSTKYHHHHHLINHHHTVSPTWHSSEHHSVPEIIYTSPPKGHPSSYLHGATLHEGGPYSASHEHYDDGWVSSGPGLGSEYISDINRVAQIDENSNYFKPHTANDASELSTWGLGPTQASMKQPQRVPVTQQQRPPPLNKQQQHQHASSHSFNPFINPDKQSIFNLKQQQQSSMLSPVYAPPRNPAANIPGSPSIVALSVAQIAAQYDPGRNNPQQQQQLQQQAQSSPHLSAQLKEAIRIQAEQRIVAQQQKILENQPFVQDGQPIMPKNYDPFYSPILLKIDKILEQLGVKDDLCKERLVCSMYKDPNRYSPHSNFVSAELSRDTNELQPIATTNEAVTRFYRLIQAARDGQEQKDCLRLYAQCNINTE